MFPTLTEKGAISLSSDACDRVSDPVIRDYALYGVLSYVRTKDIPMLEAGCDAPISTRYGFAASGRTTSSAPNVQNLRTLEGIREAFVPRPGMVFLATDYGGLELHTIAQVCLILFGHSALAVALNAGRDPHTEIAARILGLSYEDAITFKKENPDAFKNARQTGKVANFGIPGGLGVKSLVDYARSNYGVTLSHNEAHALKRLYFEQWPEVRELHSHINGLQGPDGSYEFEHVISRRMRGGMSYTAACNATFQGLGSDAARAGLVAVCEACYNDPSSVLYGSRPVAFIHDEIITESPDDGMIHERITEHARLMQAGADRYLPDVPSKTESVAMRFWSKAAKQVIVDGRITA